LSIFCGAIHPVRKLLRGFDPPLLCTFTSLKEQAFLSKDLAEIDKNVPIEFSLKECFWQNYSKEKAASMLKNLNFYSLVGKMPGCSKPEEEIVKENLKLW